MAEITAAEKALIEASLACGVNPGSFGEPSDDEWEAFKAARSRVNAERIRPEDAERWKKLWFDRKLAVHAQVTGWKDVPPSVTRDLVERFEREFAEKHPDKVGAL